jgi:hypothetical protein
MSTDQKVKEKGLAELKRDNNMCSSCFWHVVRLNQVNLQYVIECDLDILLQGQVIHNWKRKYSISRHALISCMLVQNL